MKLNPFFLTFVILSMGLNGTLQAQENGEDTPEERRAQINYQVKVEKEKAARLHDLKSRQDKLKMEQFKLESNAKAHARHAGILGLMTGFNGLILHYQDLEISDLEKAIQKRGHSLHPQNLVFQKNKLKSMKKDRKLATGLMFVTAGVAIFRGMKSLEKFGEAAYVQQHRDRLPTPEERQIQKALGVQSPAEAGKK